MQRQQWISVKGMQTSRCTLTAIASTDCQYIYALGGFNGAALDVVERYSVITDEWETLPSMLHKRFMHEGVSMTTN